MTKPMLLNEFTRLPPAMRATAFDGLSALIDAVAEQADEGYRFLRYQWFAASIAAYGGRARTLIVERDGYPVIALPLAAGASRNAPLYLVLVNPDLAGPAARAAVEAFQRHRVQNELRPIEQSTAG